MPSRLPRMLLLLPLLALFAGRVEAHAVPSLEGIQSQAELDKAITALDAALFDSYIRCDLEKFASFFADDVEFYHDQGGVTLGREKLTDSVKEDLRQSDAGTRSGDTPGLLHEGLRRGGDGGSPL